MVEILPDSRAAGTVGDIVSDWNDGIGGTTRLTLQRIYCANCGTHEGYVPREVMSFVFWLCKKCEEKWGSVAGGMNSSDQQFWQAVDSEMHSRFGRSLTKLELSQLAEQGKLGRPLELLSKESPYYKE